MGQGGTREREGERRTVGDRDGYSRIGTWEGSKKGRTVGHTSVNFLKEGVSIFRGLSGTGRDGR